MLWSTMINPYKILKHHWSFLSVLSLLPLKKKTPFEGVSPSMGQTYHNSWVNYALWFFITISSLYCSWWNPNLVTSHGEIHFFIHIFIHEIQWANPKKNHLHHFSSMKFVGEELPIGSMVLLYMVLHGSHPYTPVMLAYIPAPWIRHGLWNILKHPKILWLVVYLPLWKMMEFVSWDDDYSQVNGKS